MQDEDHMVANCPQNNITFTISAPQKIVNHEKIAEYLITRNRSQSLSEEGDEVEVQKESPEINEHYWGEYPEYSPNRRFVSTKRSLSTSPWNQTRRSTKIPMSMKQLAPLMHYEHNLYE